MDLNSINIDFLKGAKNIEEVYEGHSEAKKYLFEKNGNKYFLKYGHFSITNNVEELLTNANIFHPKIVEYGKIDEKNNYIIEVNESGNNFKYELDKLNSKYIYEYGFKIGKQYSNLRKIYPDKPMNEKFLEKYLKNINKRIFSLQEQVQKNEQMLTLNDKNFIHFILDYLQSHFYLIKDSNLVFGHSDIHPSNFIVNKEKIIAIDVEDTAYQELSLSLKWTYARGDYKDEKNLSFARGYLDGLYNLNIPDNVLKAFNYTYIYNMANYCIIYLKDETYDKLSKLITHIKKNYINNNEIIISKKLISDANIKNFSMLELYDFTIVNNSYNPNNLTFRCTYQNNDYFLKIMKTSEKAFNNFLKFYQLLNDLKIPISKVRTAGCCKHDEVYYVLMDFINYNNYKIKTYEEGYKYGNLVAKYINKLKGEKFLETNTFNKDQLYIDIIMHVDKIYEHSNYKKYMPWSKEEIINYIDYYINFFNEEKISLIHGDIKFDNILYDKKNIVFVDNENLIYSYDIINFLYNINFGFVDKVYQGFLKGYFKFMNKGNLPQRIQGQAKLLLLYYVIRTVLNALNQVGKDDKIEKYVQICQKYLKKEQIVEWLI